MWHISAKTVTDILIKIKTQIYTNVYQRDAYASSQDKSILYPNP